MNKEIMKMIILNKVSTKIDELINEMSSNEFKEMIYDEYFDNTKVSLEDTDLEVNEIISKMTNIIQLDDSKLKSVYSML